MALDLLGEQIFLEFTSPWPLKYFDMPRACCSLVGFSRSRCLAQPENQDVPSKSKPMVKGKVSGCH